MMREAELGNCLLAQARQAIGEQLGRRDFTASEHDELYRPGATFVTLMRNGELRGCIGSLEARRLLLADVRENAVGAAFRDPRFRPLEDREFDAISVEVSLLSEAKAMEFESEAGLLAQLRPGSDGIVLEYGHHRSTFLPQVWESLPEPSEFMAYLKRKAGLPANFWDDQLKIFRYQVIKWKEPENRLGG